MAPASSLVERTSSIATRLKNHLIYHRLYSDPPARSELAISELTNDGLPPPPPPLMEEPSPILPPRTRKPTAISFADGKKRDKSHRKIRFVCISDTHNASPLDGVFRVPSGDVLIHAGDFTNQGSHTEIAKAVEWMVKMPHEVKLVISGNHDGVTLDAEFHAEYAHCFASPMPQSHDDNLALLASPNAREAGIIYLNHEARTISLRDGRTFRVFGSPYSPKAGLWGFGYSPEEAEGLWAGVPDDTEVLITHTPPRFHLDTAPGSLPVSPPRGCEALRRRLWEVKPKLHVCGHVHEGRGVERVLWDTSEGWLRWREAGVTGIEDHTGEGKKSWVVDLVREPLCGGRETCVINAAVAKGEWGTRKGLERWRKKAVVVDVPCRVDMPGAGKTFRVREAEKEEAEKRNDKDWEQTKWIGGTGMGRTDEDKKGLWLVEGSVAGNPQSVVGEQSWMGYRPVTR